MLLSARLQMLLVMCLLGVTRFSVAASDVAEPAAPAASALSTEPAADERPLPARAIEACEAAVTDNLRALRGPVQRIDFDRGRPVVLPKDEEVPLRGAGRYASGSAKGAGASVQFTYGCNYNVRTGKTNGVVISDSKEAASRSTARKVAGADGNAWQPDLARLSPEACEAAVAGVLKNKYPRVGRIAFDAESRKLKPAASPERTLLQGQGGVQRAPGMAAAAFTYRCEFDERSGALADVQASE